MSQGRQQEKGGWSRVSLMGVTKAEVNGPPASSVWAVWASSPCRANQGLTPDFRYSFTYNIIMDWGGKNPNTRPAIKRKLDIPMLVKATCTKNTVWYA